VGASTFDGHAAKVVPPSPRARVSVSLLFEVELKTGFAFDNDIAE
jgi:hypothetical protein